MEKNENLYSESLTEDNIKLLNQIEELENINKNLNKEIKSNNEKIKDIEWELIKNRTGLTKDNVIKIKYDGKEIVGILNKVWVFDNTTPENSTIEILRIRKKDNQISNTSKYIYLIPENILETYESYNEYIKSLKEDK